MIVKCPNHGLIKKGRGNHCPHCQARYVHPTSQELQSFGNNIIDKARAVRALSESRPFDEDLKLAAFMAIFHNKHLTRYQAQEMRKK